MLQAVRSHVHDLGLPEPAQSHAMLLYRRLAAEKSIAVELLAADEAVLLAGLEYLALRVERPDTEIDEVAIRRQLPSWQLAASLGPLRELTRYRDYVGEWIRDGRPSYESAEPFLPNDDVQDEELEEAAVGTLLLSELLSGAEDQEDQPLEPSLRPPPPQPDINPTEIASESEVPTRWRAPFLPYEWQREAACAWEHASGRGIMEVVTGAGKTALAAFLFARLLDRLERRGHEAQLIVVVPRVELVRQWGRELRRLLRLNGLRLGEYHGGSRCKPELQDILIITQDSARQVLTRMRFDRPVFLVADECHRLGAPAASRLLIRPYTWTLGLSATPERGGDLAFEEVLIPRLGPVVFRYGYQDAVRDGIIARFRIVRVSVELRPAERAEFDRRSEAVSRTLNALKARFPVLRMVSGNRFWQVLGALKREHPSDDRFERLTVAANERRAIIHLATEKLGVVKLLAEHLMPSKRVLCFHERIEAADRLVQVCRGAGRQAAVYHSRIAEPARSQALQKLRSGAVSWLIACKSLDEGVDVPAVDTVVIVAGTRSPRQLIQRLGRALRVSGQDKVATVYLIEVAGVDDQALDADDLADLKLAAEGIVEIPGNDLPRWLSQGRLEAHVPVSGTQQSEARSAPFALPPIAPRRDDPEPGAKRRGLGARFRAFSGRALRKFGFNTWTGTQGTQSYYDKDSSPD